MLPRGPCWRSATESSPENHHRERFDSTRQFGCHWKYWRRRVCSRRASQDLFAAVAPDRRSPPDNAARERAARCSALVGERRGFEFYYAIAGTTTDPEIRSVAKEFVREEQEHVEKLKQWIEEEEAAQRLATVE